MTFTDLHSSIGCNVMVSYIKANSNISKIKFYVKYSIELHIWIPFIQLFEGMKAYRCVDDKIRMFRPMENMKRMKSTAERAYLPVSYYLTNIYCLLF